MKKSNLKILLMQIVLAALFVFNTNVSYAFDTLYVPKNYGLKNYHNPHWGSNYLAEACFSFMVQSRTLYLPVELLADSAEIYSFSVSRSLVSTGTPNQKRRGLRSFSIYMRNYTGSTFANDTIIDTSLFFKVYSVDYLNTDDSQVNWYDSIPYSKSSYLYTGWITFEFEKPFIYDGNSSLEVAVIYHNVDTMICDYISCLAYYDSEISEDVRYSYWEGIDGNPNRTSDYITTCSPFQARFGYNIKEKIALQKQPVSKVVCPNEAEIKLNIEAVSNKDNNNLRYQWYYDGKKIIDGSDYKGVNTPELSITINEDTKFQEAFYCRVWLKDNDPTEKYVQSDSIFITVLEDYQPAIVSTLINEENIDINNYVMELIEGEKLHIIIETANPTTDIISWAKLNPITKEYELLDINGTSFYIPSLQIADSGKYAVYIKNECKEYLAAEFNIAVKEKDPSSISELVLTDIEIVPNPVAGKMSIKYQSHAASETMISIIDMTGATIYTFDRLSILGLNEISLDISKLNMTNGTYFLHIRSKDKNLLKSFTVSK